MNSYGHLKISDKNILKVSKILQVLCAFIRCHLEGQTLSKFGYIDMDAPLGLSSGIECKEFANSPNFAMECRPRVCCLTPMKKKGMKAFGWD
jgi:hypothetical protein